MSSSSFLVFTICMVALSCAPFTTAQLCRITTNGVVCSAILELHNATAVGTDVQLPCDVISFPGLHCCEQWCDTSGGGNALCDYTSPALALLSADTYSPNSATGACVCPGPLKPDTCVLTPGGIDGGNGGIIGIFNACATRCNGLPTGACKKPAYATSGVLSTCICYC